MEGEVSFRIQVALRSILVSERHQLRDFMEGRSDGKEEQSPVDMILRRILHEKINICERTLNEDWKDCVESNFIRRLWGAELRVAQVALEQLMDVM